MATKDTERTYLPNSEGCFVCGHKNPAGLRTRFYVDDGMVKTPLTADTHHCGYENVVHGGITATVLDECMGWAAARAIGRMCLTAELTLRYLKPIPQDRSMTVCARVDRNNKLLAYVDGQIVDEAGEVFVRARGSFTPCPRKTRSRWTTTSTTKAAKSACSTNCARP